MYKRDYSGNDASGEFRYNNLPHAHETKHGVHNAATVTMYRKVSSRMVDRSEPNSRQDVENEDVSIRVLYERIERDAPRTSIFTAMRILRAY